jgi:hypothetical protein
MPSGQFPIVLREIGTKPKLLILNFGDPHPNERPRSICTTMNNPHHMQDIHDMIFEW